MKLVRWIISIEREIKVIHLLRNASQKKRKRCIKGVGTEEIKGESGKKRFQHFYRSTIREVPSVLSFLIRLENLSI